MPAYYVSKLEEKIGNLDGKSILVLGVSYREKVKETAFSGAFDVRDSLLSRGAKPYFIDPLYSQPELMQLGFNSKFDDEDIDGVILHTKHQEFLEYDFKKHSKVTTLIDGRNFLADFESPEPTIQKCESRNG